MPGPLFHVGATAICPHGGQIATISSNVRVLVSGMPVATMADTSLVAGCAFVVVLKPQPCLRVQWLVPAVRVLVNGQPPLLATTPGICFSVDGIPNGPPIVIMTQPRVIGM